MQAKIHRKRAKSGRIHLEASSSEREDRHGVNGPTLLETAVMKTGRTFSAIGEYVKLGYNQVVDYIYNSD
jgi:hypothetical protein